MITPQDIKLPNKVISGGQSGADLGGLIAAKAASIPTGGWIPRGFKTENGPKPHYASMYGLEETISASYLQRTGKNIISSDGTLVIYGKISPGTRTTLEILNSQNKPYLTIGAASELTDKLITDVVDWIYREKIATLNVAGNRESVSPGIEQKTISLLTEVFALCHYQKQCLSLDQKI